MALIVETGTGATNSNTFVSLSYADNYHELRGNSSWTSASDDDKEAALIRAASYLNTLSFKGVRSASTQVMAFPRTGLVDADGYEHTTSSIPTAVKFAQCEAALKELGTAYSLDPDLVRGGLVKRKKVDVIETEYFDNAPAGTVFTKINRLLKGLLKSAVSIKLSRT